MDPQIKRRRLHTVQHIVCNGQNGHGTKTFDPPVDLLCYKEGKIQSVVNTQGETVQSSLRLYFDGILAVKNSDEFLIGVERYPVLAFSPFDGLAPNTGTTVVYL